MKYHKLWTGLYVNICTLCWTGISRSYLSLSTSGTPSPWCSCSSSWLSLFSDELSSSEVSSSSCSPSTTTAENQFVIKTFPSLTTFGYDYKNFTLMLIRQKFYILVTFFYILRRLLFKEPNVICLQQIINVVNDYESLIIQEAIQNRHLTLKNSFNLHTKKW